MTLHSLAQERDVKSLYEELDDGSLDLDDAIDTLQDMIENTASTAELLVGKELAQNMVHIDVDELMNLAEAEVQLKEMDDFLEREQRAAEDVARRLAAAKSGKKKLRNALKKFNITKMFRKKSKAMMVALKQKTRGSRKSKEVLLPSEEVDDNGDVDSDNSDETDEDNSMDSVAEKRHKAVEKAKRKETKANLRVKELQESVRNHVDQAEASRDAQVKEIERHFQEQLERLEAEHAVREAEMRKEYERLAKEEISTSGRNANNAATEEVERARAEAAAAAKAAQLQGVAEAERARTEAEAAVEKAQTEVGCAFLDFVVMHTYGGISRRLPLDRFLNETRRRSRWKPPQKR